MNDSRHATRSRYKVLIIGPGSSQVGGLATFLNILFSSCLRDKYELLHLDTTRRASDMGVASRFAFVNLVYFVRQALEFVLVTIRERPQLAHVPITSYWAFWKNAAFILMAQAMGMKVVAHLHGGMFARFYHQHSRPIQRLIGWLLGRPDVIVALSTRWKRFLLDEVNPDISVEIVPNTVDPMFAEALKHSSAGAARDGERILYVGTLSQHKGVLDILKAAPLVVKQRPNACFVFAGAALTDDEEMPIQELCGESGLNDHVRFLGLVTGKDKLDLYLQASVFVLASHGENLPFSLLEAMSTGLPVVSTPVGAIPELIEEGRNGFLIRPGDYRALADRILQLLEDPPLRAKMSRANIERIQLDCMPEAAMARFDAIYSQLLDIDQVGYGNNLLVETIQSAPSAQREHERKAGKV